MNVNKIHNKSFFFTFIEIFRKQRHSLLSAFFRPLKLLSLRYKRQDRAGNGDSVRIQSEVREDDTCIQREFNQSCMKTSCV